MVHAHAVLRGDRQRLLGFSAIEHPVALQLGGSDAGELAAAARIGVEFGYDEINLNVGCPSDRVQAGRFGACLMREPALVADCVAAMRAAVSVPVTVKCRIGVDDQDSYADLERFITVVAGAGVTVFLLHARKAWLHGLSPKQNREVPPLDYERVFALKQEHPGLTVVLNGGINDAAGALAALERVAYHDPYQLTALEQALCDPAYRVPERPAVLAAFEPYAQAHLARGETLNHLARHLVGLYQGQPGARRYRRVLTELSHQHGAGWEAVEAAISAQSQPPEARAA
jgi:tRNA-dihydrouridine synthase A